MAITWIKDPAVREKKLIEITESDVDTENRLFLLGKWKSISSFCPPSMRHT